MAAPAPVKTTVPQNRWKPVKDSTCKAMCPECYVQGTIMGLEDDHTVWGCGKCGLHFALDWADA